jgi:hypothetical protein
MEELDIIMVELSVPSPAYSEPSMNQDLTDLIKKKRSKPMSVRRSTGTTAAINAWVR